MMSSPYIHYSKNPDIVLRRGSPIGKRLLILSEASKGEINEPVLVANAFMAENEFESGSLLDLYKDAEQANPEGNFVLMRIKRDQWQEALLAVESFQFDFLVTDLVRGDQDYSQVNDFIRFCQKKEQKGELVHGFFAVNHGMSESEKASLNTQIAQYKIDLPYFDEIDEQGKYFSFVSDQLNENHAAAYYAAFLTSLESQVSPVNKEMNDISLKKDYSKANIREIHEIGVVTFRSSFHHGVVVANSTTAVQTKDSPHKHISNFRIAQELINRLSQSFQQFIGQANNEFISEKIENEIDYEIQSFIRDEKIKDEYEYSIDATSDLYHINVAITIVPIFSVYKIESQSVLTVSV